MFCSGGLRVEFGAGARFGYRACLVRVFSEAGAVKDCTQILRGHSSNEVSKDGHRGIDQEFL